MRLTILTASILLLAPGLVLAQPSAADRIAAQNALFEEQWQTGLKNAPERATAVGDYRYNDKLADYSLARITTQNAENKAYLARLTAIDATGFPDQDLLSHQLMERQLKQRIEVLRPQGLRDVPQPAERGPDLSPTSPTPSRSTPSSTSRTTSPASTRSPASSPRPPKSSASA